MNRAHRRAAFRDLHSVPLFDDHMAYRLSKSRRFMRYCERHMGGKHPSEADAKCRCATQTEIAKLLGLSQSAYSKLENGQITLCSVPLRVFQSVFPKHWNYIFYGDTEFPST
jgi:DNA-binding XRE family transcriptional regulator